jgi:hypothetical protein
MEATMQERINKYAASMDALPAGKSFELVRNESFVYAHREGSGWAVWCGWVVPEKYEDDYDSYTIQPWKTPRPWVGRKYTAQDTQDAARVFAEYMDATKARQRPTTGERVGSVVRNG